MRHTPVGRLGLRRLFSTSWERFHCLPSCPAADPTFIPLFFLLGEFSTVRASLDSAVFHVLGEVSLPAQLPSRRPHFHSSFFSARRIFHCLLWFEFGCFPRPGRGFTACPAAQPPTPLSFLFFFCSENFPLLALVWIRLFFTSWERFPLCAYLPSIYY